MEVCYEVELRVKRMQSSDRLGNGPFTRVDDVEAGMKVMIYPAVLDNPEAINIIVQQIKEAIKIYYRDIDGKGNIDQASRRRRAMKFRLSYMFPWSAHLATGLLRRLKTWIFCNYSWSQLGPGVRVLGLNIYKSSVSKRIDKGGTR